MTSSADCGCVMCRHDRGEKIAAVYAKRARAEYAEIIRLLDGLDGLHARLVGFRRELGLGQLEMARRTGMCQSSVCVFERSVDQRLSTLQAYGRALLPPSHEPYP